MKPNLLNYIIQKNKFTKNSFSNNLKTINLNFGPQHPAAHGVLRLILKLNNEVIENCDPHIGLLHRGTEKLIENKIYIHSLPYFDRLDYVSTLLQEHAYCLAVDKLHGKKQYTTGVAYTRSIFDELTRILNHLLALACHALDVGSMSPIFWCFEEREKIMEFYERMSGARMHTALYRPVYKNRIIPFSMLHDILDFSNNAITTFNEFNNVLSNNKIWKIRLKNVGAYDYKTALNYGLTGVMARSTGLKKDVRLNKYTTYNNYYYSNFHSFTSTNGDCYDRFILRFYEMIESLSLINQNVLKYYKNKNNFYNDVISKINNEQNSMEEVIKHFKYWSEGFVLNKNSIYQTVESPKGEFSVYLISNGTNYPQRCKIRSPSYHHLQFIKYISKNTYLADLVTLIGTVDIVFGEIDRNMFLYDNKQKNFFKSKNGTVYKKKIFSKKIVLNVLKNNKKLMVKFKYFNKLKTQKMHNFRSKNICLLTGKHRSIINYTGFKRHKFKEYLGKNLINGISKLHK